MKTPGKPYPTGVASIGGRGGEAIEPYPDPLHRLTVTRVTSYGYEDHYITAAEAIEQRAARLKEQGTPYTRDGMTLTYEQLGETITLRYEDTP